MRATRTDHLLLLFLITHVMFDEQQNLHSRLTLNKDEYTKMLKSYRFFFTILLHFSDHQNKVGDALLPTNCPVLSSR